MTLHQCWIQQDNHPFWPAACVFDASWDGFATAYLCWACCQLAAPDPFLWDCSPAMPLPIHTCGKYFSIPVFVFVQFHAIMIAQCSNLSRSLCKASCPLRVNSTFQFSIISKIPTPVSRSLINILNRTVPRTEPWGTTLVTGLQPDCPQLSEPCSSFSSLPTEPCTCSLFSWMSCLEECCEGQNQKP